MIGPENMYSDREHSGQPRAERKAQDRPHSLVNRAEGKEKLPGEGG